MSINSPPPGYELEDLRIVTDPAALRALFGPLRSTLLDLLQERAASVAELAEAVGRPRSTVAHHVQVLLAADLVRVVRTRRVRAIDERFYGRTARTFRVGAVPAAEATAVMPNLLLAGAQESAAAHAADTMWGLHRHARLTRAQAAAFWVRVTELVQEFSALPRDGEVVFGLAVGLYPTDQPALPPAAPEGGG